MSAERWLRVKRISDAAEVLPTESRRDYILAQCGDDTDLLNEVLEALVPDDTHTSNSHDPYYDEIPVGTMVANYQILEPIGRGGMGQVYLAQQQQPFKRKVALKILSAPSDRPGFSKRFLAERQILATLEHEHIARIYDGGVIPEGGPCGGCPFFTLEYVDGTRLDTWCAEQRLSIGERLELFPKVCEAVGYAHSKQVIHRDLKPGNIMVTRSGAAKLLDFGIAKVLDAEAGEELLLQTETGGPRMLTPHYAAPEQLQRGVITPATDIYALGVVLYQLLTGHYPYRVEDNSSFGLERAIREKEPEPPRDVLFRKGEVRTPRGVTGALSAETLCLERRTNPERLRQYLSGDLERILLKMLAKDPGERYGDIPALLADLELARQHIQVYEERPEPTCDVLIWSHPDDCATVRILADHLSEEGKLTVVCDLEGDDAAASERLAALMPVSRTCLVCLGAGVAPPWLWAPEVRDALVFEVSRGFVRVLPVLLPGAALPEKQSSLPPFLRGLPWWVMDDAFSQGVVTPLVMEIQGLGPSLIDGGVNCPYRGLEAFREEHRHLFFGREAVVQRLMSYFGGHRFLALLGPSGSGKSSVVRAGLMPLLRETGHGVTAFSPGSRPLEEMAFAIHKLFRRTDTAYSAAQILDGFEAGRDLNHWAAAWSRGGAGRMFLVIDQFEETFTLTADAAERQAFIQLLIDALDAEGGGVTVLLTMRSDFLGKCALHSDLNHYVNDHFLQLGPMSRMELGRAVSEPAKVADLALEPGLQELMLDDVMGSEGELPLLEHALLELYERRRGNLLTLQAYREIGGIAGALVRRAESEYERLGPDDRETLRRMFVLFLVFPGDNTEDTRRRASREELAGAAPQPERAESLLQRLVQARLLTAFHDELQGVDMVEVAHEVLIRGWERIRVWMDRDRETVRAVNQLRNDTRAWLEADRDGDLLPRGGRLFQLGELVRRESTTLSESERDFVAAGFSAHEAAQRQAEQTADNLRRRRNQALVGGALSLVLAAAAFWMFLAARQSADEALEAENLAVQRAQEAEYNLAVAFNERVDQALVQKDPRAAWIFALSALTRDIPADRELPGPVGRFYNPEMAEAGRLVWASPVQPQVVTAALSSDGSVLAAATVEHDIRLLDMGTGMRAGVLLGHSDQIRALAFSPDGQILASGADDGHVRLWSLQPDQTESLADLKAPALRKGVSALCFSPNGDYLAARTDDAVVVWRLAAEGAAEQVHGFRVEAGSGGLAFTGDGSALWVAGTGLSRFALTQTGAVQFLADHSSAFVEASGKVFLGQADGGIAVFDGATGKALGKLAGHEREVSDLAVLGDTLYSAALDGEVRQWEIAGLKAHADRPVLFDNSQPIFSLSVDAARELMFLVAGRELQAVSLRDGSTQITMAGHPLYLDCVTFSADGSKLATGSGDQTVRLWETNTGAELGVLRGHRRRVSSLAFSPVDEGLASGSEDGTVRLWNSWDMTETAVLEGMDGRISDLAYSPDGGLLAAACWDGVVYVWDLASKTIQTRFSGHEDRVQALAFAPDGNQIASVGWDRTLRLWAPQDGATEAVLTGHEAAVLDVAFQPGGDLIATVSGDKTVRVWEPGAKAPRAVFRGHEDWLFGVAFSPDGKRLATASMDQTTRLFDVDSGDVLSVFGHQSEWAHSTPIIRDVAFHPSGKMLATASEDKRVRLWAVGGDRIPTEIQVREEVRGLSISPDETVLAFAGSGKLVHQLDLKTGERLADLVGHQQPIQALAHSADGRYLVSVAVKEALIWELATGASRRLPRSNSWVSGIDFHPSGDWFAMPIDFDVALIRVADGVEIRRLKGHVGKTLSVSISSDGALAATCSMDRTVRLWDTATGALLQTMEGHSDRVYDVAFGSGDRLLASVSVDQTVRLWDVATGDESGVFFGHRGAVFDCEFSPDGSVLATASNDKTLRLWSVPEGDEIAVLQGHGDEVIDVAYHGSSQFFSAGDDARVRYWEQTNVLTPPVGHDAKHWRDELLQRVYFAYGYRREGFRLVPVPKFRLKGVAGFSFPKTHPYKYLDQPRPLEETPADWFRRPLE